MITGKKIKTISTLTLITLIVSACSTYSKVVKGDDYQAKFELANELYTKKQYDRSIALYEQVYQRMPKSGEGELAYFRIGKAYYDKKDFYMGGYYLGAFPQRFPMSVKAQEALYLSAMCAVQNSPQYSLDQNDTELAINNFQQFIDKYPESPLVDSCNKIMDQLRFKIETKNFEALKLYSKTENYRAAVTTAISFLEAYPRTKSKEEVEYLLVKNSYLLALNSIIEKKKERIEQTIERYRTFVTDFPDSKYKRELNTISDKMNKELQIIVEENKLK